MKPMRKMALAVMTLTIAAAAGQVVQGRAEHAPARVAEGSRQVQVLARAEPAALPRLPAGEARLSGARVSVAAYAPTD